MIHRFNYLLLRLCVTYPTESVLAMFVRRRVQERAVREIRLRRAMWREREPWPWWNGASNGASTEPAGKPFTYRACASSRPYRE
jgi:hypothetical protein